MRPFAWPAACCAVSCAFSLACCAVEPSDSPPVVDGPFAVAVPYALTASSSIVELPDEKGCPPAAKSRRETVRDVTLQGVTERTVLGLERLLPVGVEVRLGAVDVGEAVLAGQRARGQRAAIVARHVGIGGQRD